MAGKLTAAFVKSARHSGRTGRPEKHCDVHGLFLQVLPSGSKQFVQRLVVAASAAITGSEDAPSSASPRLGRRPGRTGARRDVRLAFELMVLTGVRSGEARLARWEEVDFEGRT